MANMKVTPTRIMKRLSGNPITTLRARMFMKMAPTTMREGDAEEADVKLLVYATDDDDDGEGQDGHPGRQGYTEKFHFYSLPIGIFSDRVFSMSF